MSKYYFTLIFTLTITFHATFSQVHFQDNVLITPYYGYPNFGKLLLSSGDIEVTNSNYSSIGPLGLRAEYIISGNDGIGIDFIYNSFNYSYSIEKKYYDGNQDKWILENTPINLIMNRFRLQLRYTYHFDSNNSNLDWYYGIGAGINSRVYKIKENGIDITLKQFTQNLDSTSSQTSYSVFPISARICGGLNYFFIPNLAIGCEIGLGGPLISTSITYKIF